MDQYMSALGDYAGTPLGVAGADRVSVKCLARVVPSASSQSNRFEEASEDLHGLAR
jgi:hypothetical protein